MSPFPEGRVHGPGSLGLGGYLSTKHFYLSTTALIQATPFILPKMVLPMKRKERARPITTKAMGILVMSENAVNGSGGNYLRPGKPAQKTAPRQNRVENKCLDQWTFGIRVCVFV